MARTAEVRVDDLNHLYGTRLGWDPSWFDLEPDEWDLVDGRIREFQRKFPDLKDDGICGPATYARLIVARTAADLTQVPPSESKGKPSDTIVVGGEHRGILWPDVMTFDEEGGLVVTGGKSTRPRKGLGAVIHWPVTYTPQQTIVALNRRNAGTHFEIGPPMGNDGKVTIYQYADVEHHTWHAKGCNSFVGIDISSPVYARKAVMDKCARLGMAKRPVIRGCTINGWKAPPIMGYHDNQVRALAALLGALNRHAGVALAAPGSTGNYKRLRRVSSRDEITDGVYHHAEVDFLKRGKWDTAGLDLPAVVEAAKGATPWGEA